MPPQQPDPGAPLRLLSPQEFAGIIRQLYPNLSATTDDDNLLTHAVLATHPTFRGSVIDLLEGSDQPGGPYGPPTQGFIPAPPQRLQDIELPSPRRGRTRDIELPTPRFQQREPTPPPQPILTGERPTYPTQRAVDIELPGYEQWHQAQETTPLSAEAEQRFQAWIKANRIPDPDDPRHYYDLRGYWQAHGDTPIRYGVDHLPDTWKRHGHPTFSVESKYSRGPGDGGRWTPAGTVDPNNPAIVRYGVYQSPEDAQAVAQQAARLRGVSGPQRFIPPPPPIPPHGQIPSPTALERPLASIQALLTGQQTPGEWAADTKARIQAGLQQPMSEEQLNQLWAINPEAAMMAESAPGVAGYLTSPVTGALGGVQDVERIGRGAIGTTLGQPEAWRDIVGGTAELGRDAFEAGTLFIPAALLRAGATGSLRALAQASIGTVAGITAGTLVDDATRHFVADQLGWSPEVADLVSVLAGFTSGVSAGLLTHGAVGLIADLPEAARVHRLRGDLINQAMDDVAIATQRQMMAEGEAQAAQVRMAHAEERWKAAQHTEKGWQFLREREAARQAAADAQAAVEAERAARMEATVEAVRRMQAERAGQTADVYMRAWLNRLRDRFQTSADASPFTYLDQAVRGPKAYLDQITQLTDDALAAGAQRWVDAARARQLGYPPEPFSTIAPTVPEGFGRPQMPGLPTARTPGPPRERPPKGPWQPRQPILGAPPGWEPPPGPIIESTTGREVSQPPSPLVVQPEAPPTEPSDVVTLHRWVSDPGPGVPDWVRESPEYQAGQEAAGSWFTDNPDTIAFHQQDSEGRGHVESIQLSAEDAERFRVSNNPGSDAFRYSADPTREFFIPAEERARLRQMEQLAGQAVGAELNINARPTTVTTPIDPRTGVDRVVRNAVRLSPVSAARAAERRRLGDPFEGLSTDEHTMLDDLVVRAREGGFKGSVGDAMELKRQLARRWQLTKSLAADWGQSGRNPVRLLKAIAKAGGLSIDKEIDPRRKRGYGGTTNLRGELEWLRQGSDVGVGVRSGTIRGVKGVIKLRAKGGLSVDKMVEALRQDPEFEHITDINVLLDTLKDIIQAPVDTELETQFTRGLLWNPDWWDVLLGNKPTPVSDIPPELMEDIPPERMALEPGQGELPGTGPQPGVSRPGTPTPPPPPFSLRGQAPAAPAERQGALWRLVNEEHGALDLEEKRKPPEPPEGPPTEPPPTGAGGAGAGIGRKPWWQRLVEEERGSTKSTEPPEEPQEQDRANDVAASRPSNIDDDLEARAVSLYESRGAGRSPARLAAAFRDVGYRFPDRTVAERRAANQYVKALMELTDPVPAPVSVGEEQPALPGAESVRETETPTPEFEAPFSLTAPEAPAAKPKQPGLFGEPPGPIEPGAPQAPTPGELRGPGEPRGGLFDDETGAARGPGGRPSLISGATPKLSVMKKWLTRNQSTYGDQPWFKSIEDLVEQGDPVTAFRTLAAVEIQMRQAERRGGPTEAPYTVPGQPIQTETGQLAGRTPPKLIEPDSELYRKMKTQLESVIGEPLPEGAGIDEAGNLALGPADHPLRASATDLYLARVLVTDIESAVDPSKIILIEGNTDTRLRLFRQVANQIVNDMPDEVMEPLTELMGIRKEGEPLTDEHRLEAAKHWTRTVSGSARLLRTLKDWKDTHWDDVIQLSRESLHGGDLDDPDVQALWRGSPGGFVKAYYTTMTPEEIAKLNIRWPEKLRGRVRSTAENPRGVRDKETEAYLKRWFIGDRQRQARISALEKMSAELAVDGSWHDKAILQSALAAARNPQGARPGLFSALINLSQAFVVSQTATNIRNVDTQGLAYGGGVLDDMLGAATAFGGWGVRRGVGAITGRGATRGSTRAWEDATRLYTRAREVATAATRPGTLAPGKMLRHPMSNTMEVVYNLQREKLAGYKQRDARRVLSIIDHFPQQVAALLGSTSGEEAGAGERPTPSKTRMGRVVDAIIDPRIRNLVVLSGRLQESNFRGALTDGLFRAQLRMRGVEPNAILDGPDPYQNVVDKFGVAETERMGRTSVGGALSGTFAAPAYPGSIPSIMLNWFSEVPALRLAYRFPRFNFVNAPRWLYDHSLVGLLDLPLHAINLGLQHFELVEPGSKFKGRLYRGLEAAKIEAEFAPRLSAKISLAEIDMATADQDYLKAKLEGNKHARAFLALDKRGAQMETLPDELGAAIIEAGEQMQAKMAEADEAKVRHQEAKDQIRAMRKQQVLFEEKLAASAQAGMPRSLNEYWGRQAMGAAYLGAAVMVRLSKGAEDTKWYEYRVGNRTADLRAFAPIIQFLLPADMIADAWKHTDHAKARQLVDQWNSEHPALAKTPAGWMIAWEQAMQTAYTGKYTTRSALEEVSMAFLSMSRAAGTSASLVDYAVGRYGSESLARSGGLTQSIISATLATIGQFVGSFSIPIQTAKDIVGQFNPEEAKARIPQESTPENPRFGEQLYEPFASHVPGLSRVIPEKVDPLTGQPITSVDPILRVAAGLTERERNFFQDQINHTGTPYKTFALRQVGDRAIDNVVAQKYYAVLKSADIMRGLFGSPEYKAGTPEQQRDLLSMFMGKAKLQAYADAGRALGYTDEETMQRFGAKGTLERRERLQGLMDTLANETLDQDHPELRQRLLQEQQERERELQPGAPPQPGGPPPGITPRQAGGPIEPGRPYLVGEQGPEVIVPQQKGTVIPHRKAAAATHPPPPISVDEESLRGLLNTPIRNVVQGLDDEPMIVNQPAYGGQPLIVGGELAKLYGYFRHLAPNLDTRMSRIQYGPGTVATRRLQEGNYPPHLFGMSNLLGVTSMRTGETNLNPSLGTPEWLRHISMTGEYGDYPPGDVLAHELTHAAGYQGEEKPEEASQLYHRITQPPPPPIAPLRSRLPAIDLTPKQPIPPRPTPKK